MLKSEKHEGRAWASNRERKSDEHYPLHYVTRDSKGLDVSS
jgi:hypothetical protein